MTDGVNSIVLFRRKTLEIIVNKSKYTGVFYISFPSKRGRRGQDSIPRLSASQEANAWQLSHRRGCYLTFEYVGGVHLWLRSLAPGVR